MLPSGQVIAWCGCSFLPKQIPPRKPLRAERLWTLRRRLKTTMRNVRSWTSFWVGRKPSTCVSFGASVPVKLVKYVGKCQGQYLHTESACSCGTPKRWHSTLKTTQPPRVGFWLLFCSFYVLRSVWCRFRCLDMVAIILTKQKPGRRLSCGVCSNFPRERDASLH